MDASKTRFSLKYFFWASALWLWFVLGGVFLTPQGWNRVYSYYPEFLIMESLILGIAFLPKTMKGNAFLAEILIVIPVELYSLFIYVDLAEERETVYNLIYMAFVTATIVFWHHIYLKKQHILRISASLSMAIAFPFIIEGWHPYFWKNFWSGNAYLLSSICLLIISGILGIILCLCRNTKHYAIVLLLTIGATIWCATYLTDIIKTFLVYGSLFGEKEKNISIELVNQDNQPEHLNTFPSQYKVCLIWNTEKNNNSKFFVSDFERLAQSYQYEPTLSFILVGTAPNGYTTKNEPFTLYEKEHFRLPLLKATHPHKVWLQLGVDPTEELVCIFRNDTLIFQNDIKRTSLFLEKLNKK